MRRIAFVVVALVITLLFASRARAQPDLARLARQGYDLSADQASQLEESLARNPNDWRPGRNCWGFTSQQAVAIAGLVLKSHDKLVFGTSSGSYRITPN